MISADHLAGRMTINVIPRPNKDADEPALTKALSLTATPQEFDEGFVAALRGYREVRQSLADQLEATKEVLEAAKAAAVKKAADASAKAHAGRPAPAAAKPAAIATTEGAPHAGGDDDADAAPETAQAPTKTTGESTDLFG
jgi:PRTRC genetic system protein E